MIHESIEFLKRNCLSVEQLLTKEHQFIVKQYQDFKARTFDKMDRMENYYQRMMEAE